MPNTSPSDARIKFRRHGLIAAQSTHEGGMGDFR